LKVLLNQDIDRLGRMGQVVEVKPGYARNYLIPRGLAEGVTRGRVKDIEERQKVLEVKAARIREGVEATAERVKSQPIKIQAHSSPEGKLFGSITNRQLADAIKEATGDEIDRHKIIVDEKVRTVGPHTAVIRLHPDVELVLDFEVEGDTPIVAETVEVADVEAEEAEEGVPEAGEIDTAPEASETEPPG